MNELNDRLLTELVRNVFDGKLKIVFDKWPDGYDLYLNRALEQKRQQNYDASLSNYFFVVKSCNKLTTELGRSICKVLTCMQEYEISIALLFKLAAVKWDTVMSAPVGLYEIEPALAKSFEREVPTACANDFYELRDALILAARGDYGDIKALSIAKSGAGNSYSFCKSDSAIKQQALNVMKMFEFQY